MDVVRSNIEKIGGTVEFRSVFGQGSVFTIKIPLTLAIVSALIVEAGGQRFAIPQIAVREVVRATGGAESKIETLAGAPVLRLRDRLLPLIGLNRDLGLASEQATLSGQVVVCRSGNQVFGIVVDRIADAEEIVVKPLSHFVKDVGVFSGNTILGDGMVILILDVNALATRLSAESAKAAADEEAAGQEGRKTENVLLFRAMAPGLKAVPLGQVHRIERFEMNRVEWVQGTPTIQYREKILPLMSGRRLGREDRGFPARAGILARRPCGRPRHRGTGRHHRDGSEDHARVVDAGTDRQPGRRRPRGRLRQLRVLPESRQNVQQHSCH
jgi:two-component system chemotaxis sensor kinase CheA